MVLKYDVDLAVQGDGFFEQNQKKSVELEQNQNGISSKFLHSKQNGTPDADSIVLTEVVEERNGDKMEGGELEGYVLVEKVEKEEVMMEENSCLDEDGSAKVGTGDGVCSAGVGTVSVGGVGAVSVGGVGTVSVGGVGAVSVGGVGTVSVGGVGTVSVGGVGAVSVGGVGTVSVGGVGAVSVGGVGTVSVGGVGAVSVGGVSVGGVGTVSVGGVSVGGVGTEEEGGDASGCVDHVLASECVEAMKEEEGLSNEAMNGAGARSDVPSGHGNIVEESAGKKGSRHGGQGGLRQGAERAVPTLSIQHVDIARCIGMVIIPYPPPPKKKTKNQQKLTTSN